MMILFVDHDINLQEEFYNTFRATNKVFCFNEMFEAYLWLKKGSKRPDIIVSQVDIHDPAAMQTIKFLESKNKLKDAKLVAFTTELLEDSQKTWVMSEGADAVFEKKNLMNDMSNYINYLNVKKSAASNSKKKKSAKE